MSIIRATRQKGGYSSDHKATSYGGVTDEPAFKPKGKQEQQQLISWKNQRYQERIFNHTGKFLLAVFLCSLTVSSEIRKRLAISEIFNPSNVSCITRRHWGGSCSIAAIRLA